jgi:hypothetical protein
MPAWLGSDGRREADGYGVGSSNDGWLDGDGCGGPNPLAPEDRAVGIRSIFVSICRSLSRISTRVLSFLEFKSKSGAPYWQRVEGTFSS